MPMLPPMPGTDIVVFTRATTTADAEGNYNDTGGPIAQWTGRSFVGMPSATDRQVGAQRGQTIDNTVVIPNGVDIKTGDALTARGTSWVVVQVRDVRTHQRVLIRNQYT